MATTLDTNDLIRIIGEQYLENRGLRQMLQEAMRREAERQKPISNNIEGEASDRIGA